MTKSHKDILYREMSIVEAKGAIDIASPLLEELVNHSTNALVRVQDSIDDLTDMDLVVLHLYRNIIELTDGIQILITSACGKTSIPLLRSEFESYVSLKFLLQDKNSFEQKAKAWIVCHIHEKLGIIDQFDESTTRGNQFKIAWLNDEFAKNVELPKQDSDSAIQLKKRYSRLLNSETYREVEEKYKSLRVSNRRKPKWYELCGENNLERVSTKVKMGATYQIAYSKWSQYIHGTDFSSSLGKTGEGEPGIRSLRHIIDLLPVIDWAYAFMLGSTRLVINWFRPGESLESWFSREIQPYREKHKELTRINKNYKG